MINSVITLSKLLWNHKPQASDSTCAVNFGNVMTKFVINNRTDALITDANYTIKILKWSNVGNN